MADFTSIPLLDLASAANPIRRRQLLAQLRHALTRVGFLYVYNHGVPDHTVAAMQAALPPLFALPPEAKRRVALARSPHFLGYSGDGAETTAGAADRREQFEFATELPPAWRPGEPLPERLRGPNQKKWPDAYPDLRPIVESYMAEMAGLGERFLRLVAAALSLPDHDALLQFLSDQHRLKLVHYPAVGANNDGGGGSSSQGVGPHKDSSGWWTFLLQASPEHVGGLQVLNRAGGWVDVPVLPGTLVVNIGQAFEVVTHGVCKATTHRVLGGSLERFSVPFFQGVRRDLTKKEALDTFREHFENPELTAKDSPLESAEARQIDSAFLKGKYDTWGESQLRTKIRSHQDVGKAFYSDVFDKYMSDD